MTRDEYMTALKNNIQALTIDEQKEALDYYYDYFEEADDDAKVIEELGSPEQVAAIIIERFANAVVGVNKENTQKDNNQENEKSYSAYDALYYSFNKSDVKNLELGFGGAEVIVIPGETYSVETRGVLKENFLCRIDNEGTLIVKNLKKLNGLNFFNHDHVSRIVPRILISVPEKAKVDFLKITVGAGRFETKEIDVSCNKGIVDIGAGNCVITNLYGKNVNIRCGMGNVKIAGTLEGRTNIDCGMGAVKLELKGDVKEYSYDAKVGLGDFKFNDEKKSGVCQSYSEVRTDNHVSVNCGMGSVNVSIH